MTTVPSPPPKPVTKTAPYSLIDAGAPHSNGSAREPDWHSEHVLVEPNEEDYLAALLADVENGHHDDPGGDERPHAHVPGDDQHVHSDDDGVVRRDQLHSIPLGRRMARERLRGRFVYATGLGWHEWDGTRWKPVQDDRDQSRMMAVAADWAEEFIVNLVRSSADSKVIATALRYREVTQVRQLLTAAKTDRSILVESARMDAAPGLLNCPNGTVELRTGTLRPHDPADLITKITTVDYVAGAMHSDWAKALLALPDAPAADYLRRHIGAAATGETDRSGPVVFHQGDGENGKTTVIGGITKALGDYGTKIPDKLLTSHSSGEHDEIWMPLRGARLAYLEELPEDHTLPVAKIKKLTETAEMDGRPIGGHRVTWQATHSLIVSTNYQPLVAETDHGTWRRLVLLPYPHTFTGDARDDTLKARVRRTKAVQRAVLAWIVTGARDWYSGGGKLTDPPPSITTATLNWRKDNDVIAGFLIDHLKISGNPADRIPVTELHQGFNESLPTGARAWNLKLFGSRIKGHHMVKNQTLGVDRGAQNRERTALVGVVWNEAAHHAQGELVDFK